MIKIPIEVIHERKEKQYIFKTYNKANFIKLSSKKLYLFSIFIILIIINDSILISLFNRYNKKNKLFLNPFNKDSNYSPTNTTNIDFNDEFFQIPQVQNQIYDKNLDYIETISSEGGQIGNALIMLNNLIII